MNNISAIIITKNEEYNIENCLKSLLWVNEIIIVDSGSTDNTINIIHNMQKQYSFIKLYIHNEWQGFGYQKNIALNYAKNDYILSIDADEVISLELKESMQKICLNSLMDNIDNAAYYINRLNYFCNNPIKYSGWQNDKIIRFFNKRYAKFSKDLVHEKIIYKQDTSLSKPYNINNSNKLEGLLHHYSYTSYSQVLQKIEHYSSLGAKQLFIKGKKSNIIKAIIHGVTAFIKSFILKLGVLDGVNGFNIALMNALSSYYKYIKLLNYYK